MTPQARQLSLLRCDGCGAAWLTRAASALADQEDRCLHCGGPLLFEEQSDENIGTVLRAWRALLTEDLDALLDQHHPEVEIQPVTSHMTENVPQVYRGHAGIRRCIEESRGWRIVPNEVQALGDGVLTFGKLLHDGGKGATHAAAWLHRLKDGKIVSFKGYLDVRDALRELQPETAE